MHPKPILYDMHMHTPLCKHAYGEPEEYAAAAQRRGLKGIIITCHNPANDGWSPNVRMDLSEFDTYVAMVERARNAWAGQIDVRLGLECDYIPGMESWLEELLDMADFHHILGSVHPHISAYQERFFKGDLVAFQRTYFEHVAMAAETGLFDTIAHPDLVKNHNPAGWKPDSIMDTIHNCLDRIAATDTAMELNTSGLRKQIPEMNPGAVILAQMHKRSIPVVVNSDAHTPDRVAADFETAFDLLLTVGYTYTNIILNRKRTELPIAEAQASLVDVKS